MSAPTNMEAAIDLAARLEAASVGLLGESDMRGHLGASVIGEPCKRKLWYGFRWAFKEKFGGRMLRLFERGHSEEANFFKYLRAMGIQTWGESEQYRVSGVNGHFGGSMDGVAVVPWLPFGPMLLEFKTSSDALFKKLVKEGMRVAKPQHYAQCCTYGSHPSYNFHKVLYMAVNKNTDDVHIEITDLDHAHGYAMVAKADSIINSQVPVERISERATHFECKWCAASGVCHGQEPAMFNCRSCAYALPVAGAKWVCTAVPPGRELDKATIKVGCPKWVDITK